MKQILLPVRQLKPWLRQPLVTVLLGAMLLLAPAAFAQSVGPLESGNNLADVPNKATALSNLGAVASSAVGAANGVASLGSNGAVPLAQRVRTLADGLTAAGSTQGTATALTAEINTVTSAASGTGVELPNDPYGATITIINQTATAFSVYPQTGGQIDSLGTNTPAPVYPGGAANFSQVSSTQWRSW